MLVIQAYLKQWRFLCKFIDFSDYRNMVNDGRTGQVKNVDFAKWLRFGKRFEEFKYIRRDWVYTLYIYGGSILAVTIGVLGLRLESIRTLPYRVSDDGLASYLGVAAFLMAFITLPTIYAIGYKDKIEDLRKGSEAGMSEQEFTRRSFHTSRAIAQLSAAICSLVISFFLVSVATLVRFGVGVIPPFCQGHIVSGLLYVSISFIIHSLVSTSSATFELINERV